jgi:hypothetical protein
MFDILEIRDFRNGIYARFASPRVRQRRGRLSPPSVVPAGSRPEATGAGHNILLKAKMKMKNNAETTYYAIQNKLVDDPNLPAPLPAIGQTPIRESDKR